MSPDNPAIIDSMGWVQYRRGNYNEALGHLRRAYAMVPDPEIAAHLGEVLWVVGSTDEARDIWADALADDPDSPVLEQVMRRFSP